MTDSGVDNHLTEKGVLDMHQAELGLRKGIAWLYAWVLSLALALPGPVFAAAQQSDFLRGWEAYQQQDYPTAVQIWSDLAQSGDAEAQINLGNLYDYGLGVEQDPRQAVRWYRAAAEQQHAIAQYNLALSLTQYPELSVPGEQAADWMRQAALQGLADAQYELGIWHTRQQDTQASRNSTALEWFYQAGLGYLASGNLEGTGKAIEQIRKQVPRHEYLTQLQAKLANYQEASMGSAETESGVPISIGTGWPVAQGYVVTNEHVVAQSKQIVLVTASGEELQATVVARDRENDIALLRVTDLARLPPALPLSSKPTRLGSTVFTIGFPLIDVMGTSPKLSQGVISGLRGFRDDPKSYQISVPIQQGNSGGPLVNMEGEVVGVITSMLGTVAVSSQQVIDLSGINYAVKVAALQSLLESVNAQPSPLKTLPTGNRSLEELAELTKDSVLIVMAE